MIEIGVPHNDALDWENLLDNASDELAFGSLDDPAAAADELAFGSLDDPAAAADGMDNYFSIEDVEQYLMNDESNSDEVVEEHQDAWTDEFFSGLLTDSPHGSLLGSDLCKDSSSSPDSAVVEPEEEEKEEDNFNEKNGVQINEEDGGDTRETDDPVDKKRKRKIRNRDAAVRSRERKKMYVRDLELKSKYYEAECKRLGTLLQCCLAENQTLRFSVYNSKAFDASISKQESAVLLLESLLLGSLLGFLGIIYLVILGSQFLTNLEVALHEDVGGEERENVMTRKMGTGAHKIHPFNLFMMGKRCKASRSRMRLRIIKSCSSLISKSPRILVS